LICHRVHIEVEFTVDEERFKLARLTDDASGVSDVADVGVRDAISRLLGGADWAEHGLTPLRSIVTTQAPQRASPFRSIPVAAESDCVGAGRGWLLSIRV
jgi:hypothetical protein